jgi:hypothetical protein
MDHAWRKVSRRAWAKGKDNKNGSEGRHFGVQESITGSDFRGQGQVRKLPQLHCRLPREVLRRRIEGQGLN